jgi:hypothetical protein
MKTLKTKEKIAQVQEQFQNRFIDAADTTIEVHVGWRPETVLRTVNYISEHDIWTYSRLRDSNDNRYRNVFGIGKPAKGSAVPIDCLIAIPIDGIDRRIGGGFARDDDGNIYIFHRGKIGGGKKGVGKDAFFMHYSGEVQRIVDGDQWNSVVVIGNLDAPDLIEKVSSFVHEVRRIKDVLGVGEDM